MSHHVFAAPWRKRGASEIALGLLLLAACGPIGGGSSTPTPTVAPTATPIPPCTTWRIIPSPNATRYQENELSAVSALSPSEAWAVGTNYADEGSGHAATLIERWDGSAWRIVPSPDSGSLSGVAAVAPQDVWAVGSQQSMDMWSNSSPLIEHWNGTSWSVVPSPDMSAHFTSGLRSVVALASDDVWAVGSYGDPGASWPLIERWDGLSWKVVANPDLPGASESALGAVARIPGTNHLWAVGYMVKGARPAEEQALIEQWDGVAWKVVTAPALPGGAIGSHLYGVVALSATDAWLVGSYTVSDHSVLPLIAHWDGALWKIVSNAADAQHAWLTSIAAAGPQDVRVSGSGGAEAQVKPIVMRWDGASWETTTFPTPPGGADAGIGAMVADGTGGYWAVGSYSHLGSGNRNTLIARCS